MITLANHHFIKSSSLRPFSDAPVVIEGFREIETLCPISHLTGKRENPLSLLAKITDAGKASMLAGLLQQLPNENSDSRLSDSDRISVLAERLSTGVPAEDERFRARLESIADVLFYKPAVRSEVDDNSNIEFTPDDSKGTGE